MCASTTKTSARLLQPGPTRSLSCSVPQVYSRRPCIAYILLALLLRRARKESIANAARGTGLGLTACLEEMGAAAAARRVKHWENILEQQTRITHTSGRLARSARRSPPHTPAANALLRHEESETRQHSEPHSHRPPGRHCTRRPSHPAAAPQLPAPRPRPPSATARAFRCNHGATFP